MDLDGSGSGSPIGLVAKILQAEPRLPIPVPIEELAYQLDIEDIQSLKVDSFEGGLITDEARSSGFILVNRLATQKRRRFTIGHELGHFLMRNHKPLSGEFQCSRADMRSWTHKGVSASVRIEVEANQFASAVLMPPPIWKKALGCGLIKPEPQADGGDFCEGEVCRGETVISCGDVAELLEFVDASLDEVSLSVFACAERDFIGPV